MYIHNFAQDPKPSCKNEYNLFKLYVFRNTAYLIHIKLFTDNKSVRNRQATLL